MRNAVFNTGCMLAVLAFGLGVFGFMNTACVVGALAYSAPVYVLAAVLMWNGNSSRFSLVLGTLVCVLLAGQIYWAVLVSYSALYLRRCVCTDDGLFHPAGHGCSEAPGLIESLTGPALILIAIGLLVLMFVKFRARFRQAA